MLCLVPSCALPSKPHRPPVVQARSQFRRINMTYDCKKRRRIKTQQQLKSRGDVSCRVALELQVCRGNRDWQGGPVQREPR